MQPSALTTIIGLVVLTIPTVFAETPHAIRSERTIRLEPTGLTFVLPANWIEWYQEEPDNVHLTRSELEKCKDGGAGWDADYAEVVNAVLPFTGCVVHAGGEGWGRDSRSVGDLQMRVYLGNWSPKTLDQTVAEEGTAQARQISLRRAADTSEEINFTQNVVGEWHHNAIRFPVRYSDGIDEVYGGSNVEFYLRSFGDTTVVVVFMYADVAPQKKFIQEILSSFR